ncbi:hypothetical protein CEXT_252741 [Caerostris extrusa]|uniref:Uncharacterized protein n=1 Tax=Caerostris extrusa TaxID=172846 RepID=A0AAV4MZH0_CAEEX|nr:hypothetical protein CEXT_252741 [Caerostris extrusa]
MLVRSAGNRVRVLTPQPPGNYPSLLELSLSLYLFFPTPFIFGSHSKSNSSSRNASQNSLAGKRSKIFGMQGCLCRSLPLRLSDKKKDTPKAFL